MGPKGCYACTLPCVLLFSHKGICEAKYRNIIDPKMIIRIQGPQDRRKIEAGEQETLRKVVETNYNVSDFRIAADMQHKKPIDKDVVIGKLELENGVLLFLDYAIKAEPEEAPKKGLDGEDAPAPKKTDGHNISRKKDPLLCNHPDNAMCANCAPLDPWDKSYYTENKIKYLSFRSYLKMLENNKKKYEQPNYRRKKCSEHGPKASCTKCQLMPITLCPQVFRVVDHIEFDCRTHVENFIKNAKISGKSRFGYLLGKYKDYSQIPLGLKVVVNWVYEPNQKSFPDGFLLENDSDLNFAKNFGIHVVGMIYYASGPRDFFLSSLEIDFIARFQLEYTTRKQSSEPGVSRFVTIVVRMNEENEYVLDEFMVSEQCMALVKEDIIMPTSDPRLFVTNETIRYRSEEKQIESKLVPCEFFLVRLTHGMKHSPFFRAKKRFEKCFGLKKMADYFGAVFDLETFSNYDLVLRLSKEMDVTKLIEAVMRRDGDALREFVEGEDFKGLRGRFRQYEVVSWDCNFCTYLNQNSLPECEMCRMPRS
jgi:nuclear protein localization family protein 4